MSTRLRPWAKAIPPLCLTRITDERTKTSLTIHGASRENGNSAWHGGKPVPSVAQGFTERNTT